MKKSIITLATLTLLSTSAFAETKPKVPTKEASQIFKAAEFKKQKHGWEGNCDIGEITTYKDLNSDGRKDAIIKDSSSVCYGQTGVGYYIVSQQKNGKWKQLFSNSGIPELLNTTGKNGWPDIENGSPGFCFAVYRWDGQEYKVHRYEYEGKACDL